MNAFDVIIIGFGKGGKTLAAEFAKRGQKVAIIERSDKMYGGTCINIGCIPTKTLVHQAKMASALKDATFEERSEFYRNAVSVKESVTSALRNKNYHNLADNPNVTVYTGIGSFVSADVVAVRMATEEIRLTSKQIIINTGAETVIPPIEGVAGNPFVYTSTSIMELADLPRRLVIIGGGYIGLEFASMYASFGSQVTVLEKRDDRAVIEIVLFEGRNRQIRRMCEELGIEVARLKRTAIAGVKLGMLPQGKWRELTPQEVSHILSAAGAKANKKEKRR